MGPFFLLWMTTLSGPSPTPHLRNSSTFGALILVPVLKCALRRIVLCFRLELGADVGGGKIQIRFMGASVSKRGRTEFRPTLQQPLWSVGRALCCPAQTSKFRYSTNRSKPFFFFILLHMLGVRLCVGGSGVTAVGEGPMSCGCSLASRLPCLSHCRERSLTAFT